MFRPISILLRFREVNLPSSPALNTTSRPATDPPGCARVDRVLMSFEKAPKQKI